MDALAELGLWPKKLQKISRAEVRPSLDQLLEYWFFCDIFQNSGNRKDLPPPTEADLSRYLELKAVLRRYNFGKKEAMRVIRGAR
jgi:hypothetical protein